MTSIGQDLRFAARSLRNRPRYTLLAILALALGIGANTAIFSVVDGVLLRPLGYKEPDRLVVALHEGRSPVSPADFLDWRRQARSFEDMAAAQMWGPTLTGAEKPEVVQALQVTANLFGLLGVQPALGRTFRPDEDQPGQPRSVVLGYGIWRRAFHGDSGAVGKTMTLNGEAYTVIGVMPPSFRFAPFWATQAEMWVPLVLADRASDRRGRSLRVFARLRAGAGVPQAQSEMDVVCRRLAEAYPSSNADLGVQVIPLHEKVVGDIRPTLLVLLGTVGFVLLIACANVANLLLVRAVERGRETAVRLALGAGRGGLIRLALTESLLLASGGAAAGFLAAKAGLALLSGALPDGSLPRLHDIGIDVRVLLFSLGLSLFTGIVCGLAPALKAMRADVSEALKPGGRGSTGGIAGVRSRDVLVAAQVALALVLLVGAGLMIRTFQRLAAVNPGFDAQNLAVVTVATGGKEYPGRAERIEFFNRLMPRLEALPGFDSVSLVNHLPIGGDVWGVRFTAADHPAPEEGREPRAVYRVSRPGYFRTMGTPLLEGRDFSEYDDADSRPVAIVNHTLARKMWPGKSAVEKRIALGSRGEKPRWMVIVGVSADVKQDDWTGAASEEIYLPHSQSRAEQFGYMTVVARTKGDPLRTAAGIDREVHKLDGNVPVSRTQTMRQVIADALWRGRISMILLGGFSAIAILLAAVGIYGVISYTVEQRRRELGIRMALGAGTGEIVKMIAAQGMRVVGAGAAAGLAGAWILSRAIRALLFDVSATDPVTFAGAPALLLAVSAIACVLPARRAARTQPAAALRQE